MKPPRFDRVNTAGNNNYRIVFYGWDNLTEFEREQIQLGKDRLAANNIILPENYSDRDLLKFLQANAWNLDTAQVKLSNHF